MMRDAEQAIAKVMRGLAEAEAAPGFESRMERRTREAMRAGVPTVGVRFGWGLAARCLAMMGLAGALSTHWRRTGEMTQGGTPLVLGSLRPLRSMAGPDGSSETVRSRSARVVPAAPGQALASGEPAGAVRKPVAGVPAASPTSQSFPAPPMPLTEQERLLVQVARRGDARERALLNAEERARTETEEENEYLDFFGRPLPPEGEPRGGNE